MGEKPAARGLHVSDVVRDDDRPWHLMYLLLGNHMIEPAALGEHDYVDPRDGRPVILGPR